MATGKCAPAKEIRMVPIPFPWTSIAPSKYMHNLSVLRFNAQNGFIQH